MEAELVSLFFNFQHVDELRISLAEIEHHKPHKPVLKDREAGGSFFNNNIRQRISCDIDTGL